MEVRNHVYKSPQGHLFLKRSLITAGFGRVDSDFVGIAVVGTVAVGIVGVE